MTKKGKLIVQGIEIKFETYQDEDYISLTDMARSANPRTDVVLQNWLRNKNTVAFLGLWEILHNNPNFNPIEFEGISQKTGLNTFYLSVKEWIQRTKAIGIRSTPGRYGGTFAHKDIAFEFGSWLSPQFKLYLIKDYQRIKQGEAERNKLEWNVSRVLSKANYHIHTEAVRQYLIPPEIHNTRKEGLVFSSEADLLNKSLFGLTAKEWRIHNPDMKGNMRDNATTEQLIVLANLESLNAKLIEWDCDQSQRLEILNKTAIDQMNILLGAPSIKKLK